MAAMATTRPPVTNESVAKRLGLSHSMISRIRSGDRMPSFRTMQAIAAVYDWSLDAQGEAQRLDQYAAAFENVINRVRQTSA